MRQIWIKIYNSNKDFYFCAHLYFYLSIYFAQDKYAETKVITEGNKRAIQTIPLENLSTKESLDDHIYSIPGKPGKPYVLGGSILCRQQTRQYCQHNRTWWWCSSPLTAWGLNSMRVSLYTAANNIPVWEYSTLPISGCWYFGRWLCCCGNKGTEFLLLDIYRRVDFQLTMLTRFYASQVSVSRMVIM